MTGCLRAREPVHTAVSSYGRRAAVLGVCRAWLRALSLSRASLRALPAHATPPQGRIRQNRRPSRPGSTLERPSALDPPGASPQGGNRATVIHNRLQVEKAATGPPAAPASECICPGPGRRGGEAGRREAGRSRTRRYRRGGTRWSASPAAAAAAAASGWSLLHEAGPAHADIINRRRDTGGTYTSCTLSPSSLSLPLSLSLSLPPSLPVSLALSLCLAPSLRRSLPHALAPSLHTHAGGGLVFGVSIMQSRKRRHRQHRAGRGPGCGQISPRNGAVQASRSRWPAPSGSLHTHARTRTGRA